MGREWIIAHSGDGHYPFVLMSRRIPDQTDETVKSAASPAEPPPIIFEAEAWFERVEKAMRVLAAVMLGEERPF